MTTRSGARLQDAGDGHGDGRDPGAIAVDAGPEGGAVKEREAGSQKWAISPRMHRRECGQFLGQYRVWGVDPGGPSLEEMEAAGERTEEVLGPTVFSGGMSA